MTASKEVNLKKEGIGRRFIHMVFLGIREYQDPYYQGIAAQLAFYFMLSIVPTLLVLSQFLGLMDISLDFVEELINRYVKSDMGATLKYLVNYRPLAGTNITLIIMAVWAASRVQFSLTRITDYTYSSGKDTGNYWKDRVRAMLTLVITIITISLIIVAFIYGQLVVRSVLKLVVHGELFELLYDLLKWPIAGGCYFMVVSFNYYVLPTQRRKYKEILPGSIFTAIGMLAVTIGYSAYASKAVNYDLIYGSLASIVALMFWFYFLSWVLCLGILINKVWMDTKK